MGDARNALPLGTFLTAAQGRLRARFRANVTNHYNRLPAFQQLPSGNSQFFYLTIIVINTGILQRIKHRFYAVVYVRFASIPWPQNHDYFQRSGAKLLDFFSGNILCHCFFELAPFRRNKTPMAVCAPIGIYTRRIGQRKCYQGMSESMPNVSSSRGFFSAGFSSDFGASTKVSTDNV